MPGHHLNLPPLLAGVGVQYEPGAMSDVISPVINSIEVLNLLASTVSTLYTVLCTHIHNTHIDSVDINIHATVEESSSVWVWWKTRYWVLNHLPCSPPKSYFPGTRRLSRTPTCWFPWRV